jgi:hypothetical protein
MLTRVVHKCLMDLFHAFFFLRARQSEVRSENPFAFQDDSLNASHRIDVPELHQTNSARGSSSSLTQIGNSVVITVQSMSMYEGVNNDPISNNPIGFQNVFHHNNLNNLRNININNSFSQNNLQSPVVVAGSQFVSELNQTIYEQDNIWSYEQRIYGENSQSHNRPAAELGVPATGPADSSAPKKIVYISTNFIDSYCEICCLDGRFGVLLNCCQEKNFICFCCYLEMIRYKRKQYANRFRQANESDLHVQSQLHNSVTLVDCAKNYYVTAINCPFCCQKVMFKINL